MSDHILVAYASGSGSTGEVAEAIGEVLRTDDVEVEVRHVNDVTNVRPFSAIVLGSSIRGGRWLPEASQFLEAHKETFGDKPVAYFTTCLTMVNDTEESRKTVLAYMEPVLQAAPEVDPVGLGLFAGSLNPGYSAVAPQGGPYGDYRNWAGIRAWAAEIRPALLTGRARDPLVLTDAVLSYTDMSRSDLSGYDFQRADLHRANLSEANLQGSNLSETKLTKADLQAARLNAATLNWAHLNWSNMQGADLGHANLIGADLSEANLVEADLSQAILNGANLKRAKLRGVNLHKADLNWANLSEADLTGANLREANMGWANLIGADLSDADLSGARYNDHTYWPEGFSAEAAGCTYIGEPH